MKRIVPALMVAVLLLFLLSSASAQEEAKYNFASAQGNKEIKVAPGGEGEGVIYFYNIEGNRITHISLEISKAPDNWKVAIEPPQHEIQANVSGRMVTVTENLHVEPSQVLSQETQEVPEGMVCLKIGNLGYVLAKAVRIVVQVPESLEVGTKSSITIAAEAEWLGQSGAATIKQAREFEFFVEVISEQTEFSETIVGEVQKDEAVAPPPAPTGSPSAAADKGSQTGTTQPTQTPAAGSTTPVTTTNWLPAILGGVVVILGVFFISLLIRRRRQ